MLIDIGANLTHESFQDDLDEVLARAFAAGVRQMVVTGASVAGSESAATIAAGHPQLFATAGIHPHHAEESGDAAISRLRDLAAEPQVVAIGETGLDYFRDFSPRETQQASFKAHLELAAELNLPVFLHERDAFPDFADILATYRDQLPAAVVHCFTGDRAALEAYLAMDCHIGITGWVSDERRGLHLHELLPDIPGERLLLETDSPYLMPRHIRPRPKTRRNEPFRLASICEYVAALLDQSPQQLATQTTINARRFFALPEVP